MAIILSLETATTVGSVALHRDGEIIGHQFYNLEKSHSRLIHELISQLLSNSEIKREEIDAVAVSGGPGSYTGLRIGVSAAKGLCYALNKPLIAVNTLEAMALQVGSKRSDDYLLCPMIDARRMEVYCALYTNTLEVVMTTDAKIIDTDSFKERLYEEQVVFFGNGAEKCRTAIQSENAVFLEGITPSALEVGVLATKKYKEQAFEDVAYYEPFYLKEFRIIQPKSH